MIKNGFRFHLGSANKHEGDTVRVHRPGMYDHITYVIIRADTSREPEGCVRTISVGITGYTQVLS